MTGQRIRSVVAAIASTVCLASVISIASAATPTPPPGATSGAAQPHQERSFTMRPSGSEYSTPSRSSGSGSEDVTQGQRIAVTSFQLEGGVERQQQGINLSEISTMANQMVSKEGMTFAQIQAVADEITRIYRSAGFILATAIIPEQSVSDGVIAIRILEGTLGRVSIDGDSEFKERAMTRFFDEIKGQPVYSKTLNNAMLRVNDLPGVKVFGVFQPGVQVGEADLLLTVKEEQWFDTSLRLDNHGTEFTGELRFLADGVWNNVSGVGDTFSAGVLVSMNPANNDYGHLNYHRPVMFGDFAFDIGYSENRFNVGQDLAVLDIDGDTKIANLTLSKQLIRQRSENLSINGGLNWKKSRTNNLSPNNPLVDSQRDAITSLQIGVDYETQDRWDSRFAGINLFNASYTRGIPDFLGSIGRDGAANTQRAGVSGQFDVFTASAVRLQPVFTGHNLLLRASAQFTEDLLMSLEQFALGGPDSVRGYGPSDVLGDKGYFVSAEWQIAAPGFSRKSAFGGYTWGEILQFSVFSDYGVSKLNNPNLPQALVESVEIGSVGAGVRLLLPDQFMLRLQVATPFSDHEPVNGRDSQFYMTLKYDYGVNR